MLSDRDYMYNRNNRQRSSHDDNPNRIVWILIAINVLIYFGIQQNSGLYNSMAMTIAGIQNLQYWRLITSMFLHGGFGHILFNMYGIYLFGTLVAPHIGTSRFLGLYFISGVLGNVLWMIANWHSPGIMTPEGFYISYSLVGASGGVFGVMLGAAMLEPQRQFILLIPPIPIKCKTMVVVYGVIEIFSELSGMQSGIAHLAHLGGMLGGYVFLKMSCNNLLRWDILDVFKTQRPGDYIPPKSTPPPQPEATAPKRSKNNTYDYRGAKSYENKSFTVNNDKPVSRRELDQLLDKISYHGINSLTPEEQAKLKRAREQMRQR
jgi:rhomboid family protein